MWVSADHLGMDENCFWLGVLSAVEMFTLFWLTREIFAYRETRCELWDACVTSRMLLSFRMEERTLEFLKRANFHLRPCVACLRPWVACRLWRAILRFSPSFFMLRACDLRRKFIFLVMRHGTLNVLINTQCKCASIFVFFHQKKHVNF